MRLRAFAKINLGLDVVRRMENGYHEVRMIMQTINMFDQLTLEKSDKPGIHITTNLSYVPTNENNLVYRAADMLMKEFGIQEGVDINLYKVIPVSAGMAGGSSDAAATLVGINRLFELGLNTRALMKRGVQIGADVPYCVKRGTALAEGIGEKLSSLKPMPMCYILVAKPGVNVSTKIVYDALDANHLEHHPDIDGMIGALKEQDLYKLSGLMENVLEEVTIRKYPIIEEIKKHMKNHGAVNAMMSGSGPTVFGIFDNYDVADQAAKQLRDSGLIKQLFLTTPFNTGGTRG